jgi:hypothetical protein
VNVGGDNYHKAKRDWSLFIQLSYRWPHLLASMNYVRMTSGWWYTYPSEKYESQLWWLFPIYGKIKNVPNHQPDIYLNEPNYCTNRWIYVSYFSVQFWMNYGNPPNWKVRHVSNYFQILWEKWRNNK